MEKEINLKVKYFLIFILLFVFLFSLFKIFSMNFNNKIILSNIFKSETSGKKSRFFSNLTDKKDLINEAIKREKENKERIKGSINSAVSQVLSIQANVLQKEGEINKLEEDIVKLKERSKELQESAKLEKEKKDSFDKTLKARLRAMYLSKKYSKLEILLKSKNLMDIFSNYYMLSQISKIDSQTIRTVENSRRKFENIYKEMNTTKERIAKKKEDIEKSKIAQENLIKLKNARVNELKNEENQVYQKLAKLESDRQQIEREIEREASRVRHMDKYVGGTFAWPVPECSSTSWITAYYGDDWNSGYPGAGHSGVDIAIPRSRMGSIKAVAAQDGRVIIASYGYNGGYGNYVMIDHGGGIYSIYGHAQSLLVNPGQYVKKGQPILFVGSTGYSTGPHLHYEMRIGGYSQSYRRNPLPYITTNARP